MENGIERNNPSNGRTNPVMMANTNRHTRSRVFGQTNPMTESVHMPHNTSGPNSASVALCVASGVNSTSVHTAPEKPSKRFTASWHPHSKAGKRINQWKDIIVAMGNTGLG
ncbi:MAG: hypothetical protein MI808_22045 [Pseudomonadales bacterium]|nr:hypothetical protein [Pseudomonadales bacterium]